MKAHIIKGTIFVVTSFFVVLIILLSSFFHVSASKKVEKPVSHSSQPNVFTSIPASVRVLASIQGLIPTATPTPPPIVYTGFCLSVPVLMYHHTAPWEIAKEKGHTSLDVDSGIFDQQMGYLASHGYTTLFANDLVNALRNHTALPPKSIVVTLDDGYDDVYYYAFPVAKKYGIKMTVFVPTGLLGNTSGPNSYYSWGQLHEMVGSGLVKADNHTWSHFPMGTQGTDKDVYEVKTAEDQLQQNLGTHAETFAYPYGTNAGMGRLHSLLAQDGFTGAFSTIGGTTQCDSFIYSLHRTRVGNIPFPAYGI